MTEAQRKAKNKREQRQRDKAAGLLELRVLIHKDDRDEVMQLAAELRRRRGIAR